MGIDWKALEGAAEYTVFTREFDQEVHIRDLADDAFISNAADHVMGRYPEARGSDADRHFATAAMLAAERAGDDGAAVTILVDNSGSMRSANIDAAAAAAALMAWSLEQAGVATEVLGYTTRNWKGGEARKAWVAAGRPGAPGRLSECRHVIYKEAGSMDARDAYAILAMADRSLAKENLDNEAVAWAAWRLEQIPVARRVLLVITDGVRPICDATMSLEGGEECLTRHHRAVVEAIESDGAISMGAILLNGDGTGPASGPSPYSRLHRAEASPEDIMAAAAQALDEMLCPESAPRPL